MKFFTRKCVTVIALVVACSLQAVAAEQLTVMNSKFVAAMNAPTAKIETLISKNFPQQDYRDIKVQIITNAAREPDHLLVFLFLKYRHGLKLARVNIDSHYRLLTIQNHAHLTPEDFSQQPGGTLAIIACPDDTTQFITFAPNTDALEQAVTEDVGDAAEKHKLKVVRLLHYDATRKNYLSYMSCPNIKGNFFDGDAYHDDSDPDSDFIVTIDGVIQAKDIETYLKNHFKFKTVNIWVACSIFHDAIKTAMLDTAQSQKFAAGINDLFVGPSDLTAACAMEAALDGKPMTASFQACYEENLDHWGFSGSGSDYFSF
jgi:hypothetical protein